MNRSRNRRISGNDFSREEIALDLDFINQTYSIRGKGQTGKLLDVGPITGSSGPAGGWLTFTGPVGRTYVDNTGLLIKGVAANAVRYDHDPSTYEPRGALIEFTHTNLCLQSEDFSTTWTTSNSSISTDTEVAPDGTTTADTLIEDSTAGAVHTVIQNIASGTSSTRQPFSVWAKPNGRSWVYLEMPASIYGGAAARAYFDVTNGVVGTVSGSPLQTRIEAWNNGWFRISIGKAATVNTTGDFIIGLADADNSPTYNGDGASGVYLWGAQLDTSSLGPTTALSYKPTTTTSNALAGDVFSISPNTGLLVKRFFLNETGMSCYVEFKTNTIPGSVAPSGVCRGVNQVVWGGYSGGFVRYSEQGTSGGAQDLKSAVVGDWDRVGMSMGYSGLFGEAASGLGVKTVNNFDGSLGSAATDSFNITGAGSGAQWYQWYRRIVLWTHQISRPALTHYTKGTLTGYN